MIIINRIDRKFQSGNTQEINIIDFKRGRHFESVYIS